MKKITVFLIVTFFLFIFLYYLDEIKYVQTILFITCSLIFCLYLLKKYFFVTVNIENYLGVSTILVAALFFVLQILQISKDAKSSIKAINNYNCSIAKELIKNISDDQNKGHSSFRSQNRYFIDIYKKDMQYLPYFSSEQQKDIFKMISNMDASNRILDMIFSASQEKINLLVNYNEDRFLHQANVYEQLTSQLDLTVLAQAKDVSSELEKIGDCN